MPPMALPLVLIVDDDKLTRWSVSRILGRAGYQVREAGSLTEGEAALERQRPDLILLDIRLPDGDGFALLKAVRLGHPDLPVIMMTAHASPETEQAALALGARGHLAKPCDPTELQAVVGNTLARGVS
jgi:two-component system nitrogen regulation response regulator GlnG